MSKLPVNKDRCIHKVKYFSAINSAHVFCLEVHHKMHKFIRLHDWTVTLSFLYLALLFLLVECPDNCSSQRNNYPVNR